MHRQTRYTKKKNLASTVNFLESFIFYDHIKQNEKFEARLHEENHHSYVESNPFGYNNLAWL